MPHVLIIGAGITGFLIAQGLKKAGIPYTIFDAESPGISRPREWTLALHWSLPYVEKLLSPELFARISEAVIDPSPSAIAAGEVIQLRNSATGDILKTINAPGMRRVSRKKLRTLCGEGIDVQWGKTLVDITYPNEESVTAHFKNGSEAQGDILIGADGPKSKVRELLLGKEKGANTPVGIHWNTAIATYGDAEKAKLVRSRHAVNCLGYNPNGKFHFVGIQNIPDTNKPETWSFQISSSWLGQTEEGLSNKQKLKMVKDSARDLSEPWRSANLEMPDGTVVHNDKMIFWVPVPWDGRGGRVSLAGDACHPLPPHRGQGLNHSILDALNFVEAVKKIEAGGSKEKEMAGYDEEAIRRGAEEVKLSVNTTHTIHNWAEFMESPLMKYGVTKMS